MSVSNLQYDLASAAYCLGAIYTIWSNQRPIGIAKCNCASKTMDSREHRVIELNDRVIME